MSQSLSQLFVHLTYGTLDRYPFIKTDWEEDLHSYIGGILRNLSSPAVIINSVSDHIHILFLLSKNFALAKVVEEVKRQSTIWVKSDKQRSQKFAWQGGYGAFSISSSQVEKVKQYIANQKELHKKYSYREEVEALIKEYDIIAYDPEYFWK